MLKDEHDLMVHKLELAEMLIKSLKDEKESWKLSLARGQEAQTTIVGDILIASGIMAYLGVFTASYREECINEWVKLLNKFAIKCSENVNLTEVLGDQVKIV